MAPGAGEAESLSYAEARARVLAAVRPLAPEILPVGDARGRALRRAVRAPHPLPPFRNSSMDGYAVASADLAAAAPASPVVLPVVGVIPAGHVAPRALAPGETMRIMTGAAIPEGADAVVAVEDTGREESSLTDRASFRATARPGLNIREAGRDVAAGDVVLAEGRELSPADLALAAALGEAKLPVSRRPRAVVISTGDELLDVDQPLRPGAIRDSNRIHLGALLEECGVIVARSVRVGDRPDAVAEAVRAALDSADVVLTIGGVSAGDFDPVKQSLRAIGDVSLWRVAMKPGRPQAFGTPGGRLFFGLPGNPASVACTFEALVRPALRRLMGYAEIERARIEARASRRFESREGRMDFARVTLSWRDGGWWAEEAGEGISGHLSPQSRAHALLEIGPALPALESGESAPAIVLRWPATAPA